MGSFTAPKCVALTWILYITSCPAACGMESAKVSGLIVKGPIYGKPLSSDIIFEFQSLYFLFSSLLNGNALHFLYNMSYLIKLSSQVSWNLDRYVAGM